MARSRGVNESDLLTIGVDTGGTYTDAVVCSRRTGNVIAKTKVRTTHRELNSCVSKALRNVLNEASVDAATIGLVCVSTTLATNALVEGSGRPAGLIAIGLDEGVTERRGLAGLTEANPLLRLKGGHSSYGLEAQPLEVTPLREWLADNDKNLEAYAVVGSFSVRNPDHELRVAEEIKQITNKPVTLSHELSGQLDAAKRSVTALLNARLVPLVGDLIVAVEGSIAELGINSRLMVMRGDGSLVSSDFVRSRPIETILSGPAASAIGAVALSGVTDGVVVDIGGTTTDVAVIRDGRPSDKSAGARVGGYETMVKAIRIHTEGIGGDSQVRHTPLDSDSLTIGPRRVTPLAVATGDRPQILEMLEEQCSRSTRRAEDGIYLWVEEGGRNWTPSSAVESKVFEVANASPEGVPLEDIVGSRLERTAADRLVSLGVLGLTTFTPTDAAHVLEIDRRFNAHASNLGADILARQMDRFGVAVAQDGPLLSAKVMTAATHAIGRAVLSAGADHDGLPASDLQALLQASAHLSASPSAPQLLEVSIAIRNHVVCIGAPTALYETELSSYLGTATSRPTHFDVANAYGAAIGSIRITVTTNISAPRRGLFRVHTTAPETFYDLQVAQDFAEANAEAELSEQMCSAGADQYSIDHHWNLNEVEIDGRQLFIEGQLQSEAKGSPS